jgi:pyruvate formate lyase activating enzyme
MPQSLVGSRYQLHVARVGADESKSVGDYYAIHAGDTEEVADGSDVTGYVHSYEVGSTVDGPGIRFVAFLTGCLLRCQYCHNPDTWHKHNGHPVTVARAMREIGKYAQVLKISKGGITISGGEPVVQKAFVMQIFRRCKALGLHTALDTSGRLGERLSDDDLASIDLNILDIKSGDPATYERITRQPLQPTLDYAKRLSALRRPMWVRYVLVPGLSHEFDNVERVAEFCGGLQSPTIGRARRDPALPPDGPRQVAQARPRLSAGERRASGCRAQRARARPVPQPGPYRLLRRKNPKRWNTCAHCSSSNHSWRSFSRSRSATSSARST